MAEHRAVLAISGSLRAWSHNTALLRASGELAPRGVEIELYDGLDLVPTSVFGADGGLVDDEARDRLAEILTRLTDEHEPLAVAA
jgi:NAD(P)H-dependent FMN reductase